ncbi:MAG TPA: FtsX-like permease family protein [Anaeromyxobacteraceae bacterium]|nr:FtsX-like permease family protein [Anaeromyxobacteraceae bacterium]
MAPPLLRIAARSVLRNARHSAGTILAIAVGFLALTLFDGYLTFIEKDTSDAIAERFMVKDVLVERPGAIEARQSGRPFHESALGEREQAFLDGWLAAHAAEAPSHARFLYLWGSASAGKASAPFLGYGYDVAEGARLRGRFAWDALVGRPLWKAGDDAVLLGRGLGGLLDCAPTSDRPWFGEDGLPIAEERPFACRRPRVQLVVNTASGQLNAAEPEVVGLLDGGLVEFDSKYANLPMALAQRLMDTRAVSLYAIKLTYPRRAAVFSRELVAAARAQGVELEAVPWQEHISGEENRRSMRLLGTYRVLVALVVLLIASMSVLTTMAKAVAERTREVGTLRSLGFLRRDVVRLFALEGALLSLLGTAVGAAASVAAALAVNRAGITYDAGLMALPFPLRIALEPATFAGAAAFLALLATAAAIVPARRAARSRIPEALAHV